MKYRAILIAGLTGAMMLGVHAGATNAQVRAYPDGNDCAHLTGGALVTCQNQVYRQQLESGMSRMMAGPAEVPSSHIEGNEAAQSDFVPGAEGTGLPSAYVPGPVYSTLPGPEGTVRIYRPAE